MLLLVLPVLPLIATLIIADGGSVLYAHRRIGRNGREFGCLKFRTMRPDADAALLTVLAKDCFAQAEWAATRKLKEDPRITKLGRILRVTSLDELPQLLNVLRGDMSLVGPRPVTREELDIFYAGSDMAAYRSYLSLRPGLTGPWQISGRSNTGYCERVALDLAYARNLSFRGDLVILARTCVAVMQCKGAR